MRGKDIFAPKRKFDLDKAIPLSEFKTEFVLTDFEIFYSKKYNDYFTVIETAEGKLLVSWSKVITDKFKKLSELPSDEWIGMVLKVVKRKSSNGRIYTDLEAV